MCQKLVAVWMKTSEITSVIRGWSANKGGQSLENEDFFTGDRKIFNLNSKMIPDDVVNGQMERKHKK